MSKHSLSNLLLLAYLLHVK